MLTLDLARFVTDEELLALAERNPGYQFERTREGRLLVTPTGGESGRRSAEVLYQLSDWNRRAGLGYVFDASTGFHLPDGSLLCPDASWVERSRWETLSPAERAGFPPLCPDAVFEVRSPSNTAAELGEKMRTTYLANGARLAVLVDPEERAPWRCTGPGRRPRCTATPLSSPSTPSCPGSGWSCSPFFRESVPPRLPVPSRQVLPVLAIL